MSTCFAPLFCGLYRQKVRLPCRTSAIDVEVLVDSGENRSQLERECQIAMLRIERFDHPVFPRDLSCRLLSLNSIANRRSAIAAPKELEMATGVHL
jgi:hypothetical protein